jgi:hypothetical protein
VTTADNEAHPHWGWGWQFWTPIVVIMLAGTASTAVLRGGWAGFGHWLHEWETLIAGLIGGGLTLAAGILAYTGARSAANRQIRDLQADRKEADRRQLSVIKWTIRAEGRRLASAAADMVATEERSSIPGRPPRAHEPLAIETSRLLRGEREGIALLEEETRRLLELTAQTLDAYNLRIKRQPYGERTAELLQDLNRLAGQLRGVTDGRTNPGS